MILFNYIFNWISFSSLLNHKSHLPSFITFITHHLFWLKGFNKLNGVDEFPSEVWYTTKWLVGSLDGIDLRTNEGVELGFPDKSDMWCYIARIIMMFQWWDYRLKFWGFFTRCLALMSSWISTRNKCWIWTRLLVLESDWNNNWCCVWTPNWDMWR